jgi:SAM-dependent methyltransferase
MKFFISPHDDDQVLFGAYTIMREKPHVLVVFDSYSQPARGYAGCDAETRANESTEASRVLGIRTPYRLGLHDDTPVTVQALAQSIYRYINQVVLHHMTPVEVIYAPEARPLGNEQHNLVAEAVNLIVNDMEVRLVQYTTYTTDELWLPGSLEIRPTTEEVQLKKAALDCFPSQIRYNLPHFQAVVGKSEWTLDGLKLHLGCGRDVRPGWVNVDRKDYGGGRAPGTVLKVADIARDPLPLSDDMFDYAYSQDFLEHLPSERRVHVINEIWRVLKPGGLMEHYVPNASSRNAYGSPTHLSFWNLQVFEHFDVNSYRWAKDREFEGVESGFECVTTRRVNPLPEEDGVTRFQSIHVRYRAVK